ncbi:hypothetical protein PJM48_29240, partial [Mycobacterium kansasii]
LFQTKSLFHFISSLSNTKFEKSKNLPAAVHSTLSTKKRKVQEKKIKEKQQKSVIIVNRLAPGDPSSPSSWAEAQEHRQKCR